MTTEYSNLLKVVSEDIPMSMDCSKCHAKCKAECCSEATPIPKPFLEKYADKIVNQPIKVISIGGEIADEGENIIASTPNQRCMFLNEDYSCNIYQDRPKICRQFGNESHIFLTCSFQSKDGRIRSRQEKRLIERQNVKAVMQFNSKMIRDFKFNG